MALTEDQALVILLALIQKPGPVEAVPAIFEEIVAVHRRNFGPQPVDVRPGAPASVYLAPRPRRPKQAPAPRRQESPADPVLEVVAELPVVLEPEPTAPVVEASPPRVLHDWPRRAEGPLPRIRVRPAVQEGPAPTPAPAPQPLDPRVHARLTARGPLCATCRHGSLEPRAEDGYACAQRANECVPRALGKLYTPK